MISIGMAAAQLGLSTSTLRKWESRYGLPAPQRASGGTRWYTETDLARLVDIKRRIDRGEKPAQVMQPGQWLQASGPTREADSASFTQVVTLLRNEGVGACQQWLHRQRLALGAQGFVDTVAAPLMTALGEGWARGEVAVYEQHGLATLVETVLAVPPDGTGQPGDGIQCLLATLSGEWHTLGLSMLKAVLHEAGTPCISLGASVPNAELVAAARAWRVPVVALSLSAATAPRAALSHLRSLRQAMPGDVAIWVGGAGVGQLARLPDGVVAFANCGAARDALSASAPVRCRYGAMSTSERTP